MLTELHLAYQVTPISIRNKDYYLIPVWAASLYSNTAAEKIVSTANEKSEKVLDFSRICTAGMIYHDNW